MPAALAVPWTRIAAEAAAGAPLEELSRTYNVSVNTLKARSAREGWKVIGRERAAAALGPEYSPADARAGSMQPRATNAPVGLLERLGSGSRVALARSVNRAAQATRLMKGKAVIAQAQQLKALTDTADKLHGWSKNSETAALVNITIGPGAAPSSPVIDLEGL